MEDTQKEFTLGTYRLLIEKHGQFLKFCLVGAVNTTISLAVYYILLKLDIHYLLASSIAYCAGLVNGYFFSSSYVFQQRRSVKQASKFIFVNASSLVINLLLLYLLVDVFGVSKIVAQVFVTCFNVVYNFFLNKWWTFK
jgi:putative flippase GtrA